MFASIALIAIFIGFIIGLGAVTIIDIHGFLGRQSSYWTLATTRTHKITKPMIWIGMTFLILGSVLWYRVFPGYLSIALIHTLLYILLIVNGIFLSFRVSPFLLDREKQGQADVLLPAVWQKKIIYSFIVSFVCWWASFFLFIYQIYHLIT